MELKDMEVDSPQFQELIDQLITSSKELISRHYTEYDEEFNAGIIN